VDEPDETDRIHIGNAMDSQFTVISGTRKLIWCAEGGQQLVFDLADDPYETKALDDPAEDLRSLLIEHLENHHSPLVQQGALCPKPTTITQRNVMRFPGFPGCR
jgi:hypothetical protein